MTLHVHYIASHRHHINGEHSTIAQMVVTDGGITTAEHDFMLFQQYTRETMYTADRGYMLIKQNVPATCSNTISASTVRLVGGPIPRNALSSAKHFLMHKSLN